MRNIVLIALVASIAINPAMASEDDEYCAGAFFVTSIAMQKTKPSDTNYLYYKNLATQLVISGHASQRGLEKYSTVIADNLSKGKTDYDYLIETVGMCLEEYGLKK